jgi:hypothetical protein
MEVLTETELKRQLADLSAKVRLYESVIRNVSLRFGVSGQQLINNAIKNVSPS